MMNTLEPPPLPIAPWREGFVETPEVRLRYLEWGDNPLEFAAKVKPFLLDEHAAG